MFLVYAIFPRFSWSCPASFKTRKWVFFFFFLGVSCIVVIFVGIVSFPLRSHLLKLIHSSFIFSSTFSFSRSSLRLPFSSSPRFHTITCLFPVSLPFSSYRLLPLLLPALDLSLEQLHHSPSFYSCPLSFPFFLIPHSPISHVFSFSRFRLHFPMFFLSHTSFFNFSYASLSHVFSNFSHFLFPTSLSLSPE